MDLKNAWKKALCFLDWEDRAEEQMKRDGWKFDYNDDLYFAAITNYIAPHAGMYLPRKAFLVVSNPNNVRVSTNDPVYHAARREAAKKAYGLS